MNINYKAEVNLSLDGDIIPKGTAKQLYQQGIQDVSEAHGSNLYTQIINPMRQQVSTYRAEFERDFVAYTTQNSVLRKMKNVLDPSKSQRGESITLDKSKYQNKRRTTLKLIDTMDKGHALLLQMRETLTGQQIKTKFYVKFENKVYIINESNLNPKKVLSAFGGETVSNPFSVAYELDRELLKTRQELAKDTEISKTEIWQTIWSLKRSYLDNKSEITKRKYENIYFDSKDAEIYELLSRQKEPLLDLPAYTDYRARMGGGGGYRTAFYKGGDVGDTQVKFFNLDSRNKSVVNYGRLSLLRDKFKQLDEILQRESPYEIGKELLKFFTEDESKIKITEKVDREFNREAQEMIRKLFGL